jgi:L-rhamnose isomerase
MTTQVSISTLPTINHNNLSVISTEMLAQLYGAEVKNIQNNYLRNEGRFIAGKHYFKLERAELKEFKNKPSLRGLVANRAKHLLLWTERGAARHAKMLETDQAWEVFEKLEDCYFNKISFIEPRIKLNQQDNFVQELLVPDSAITQLNALFQCAEHLRLEMWPHLVALFPELNRDYKLTFETLAMASALLKKKREECRLKAEIIMSGRIT